MRQGAHLLRLRRGEMALAVEIPKPKPLLEMLRANAELQMGHAKSAAVAGRPAGLPRPELGDLPEVLLPVLNVHTEDGAEHAVLPHVDVERVQQGGYARVAAEAVV